MDDRKVWSRDLVKSTSRQRCRALWLEWPQKWSPAPLTTGSNNHIIHHVVMASRSENKGTSHRCWICKTQAHWTDECQKCLALNHEERINPAQEIHACFGCLKRAETKHKITTCSLRKQWTQIENSIWCKQYHHPLLHKKNVTNVARYARKCSETSVRNADQNFLQRHFATPW